MIDPTKIPVLDLESISALSTVAGQLKTTGTDIGQTGADVDSTFQGLSGFYDAPEAAQLLGSTNVVRTHSDGFGSQVTSVGSALADYAEEIRPIATRLGGLRADAETFAADVEGDDDWQNDDDKVEENNRLLTEVNAAVVAFMAAERRAHNRIQGLIGGPQLHPGDPENDPLAYGPPSAPEEPTAAPWGTPEEKRDWMDKARGWVGDNIVPDWGWAQTAWNGYSGFLKGFWYDGVWGTLYGLYQLSPTNMVLNPSGAAQAWQGVGMLALDAHLWSPVGMLVTRPLLDRHAPGLTQQADAAGTNFLKGMVAWDTWSEDPGRAAGAVTFNVASFFIPGPKGGGALSRIFGGSADDLARVGAGGTDDLARLGTGGTDDLARLGLNTDELARLGVNSVDDLARLSPDELARLGVNNVDDLGRLNLPTVGDLAGQIDDAVRAADDAARIGDDAGRITDDAAGQADNLRPGTGEGPPSPAGGTDDLARGADEGTPNGPAGHDGGPPNESTPGGPPEGPPPQDGPPLRGDDGPSTPRNDPNIDKHDPGVGQQVDEIRNQIKDELQRAADDAWRQGQERLVNEKPHLVDTAQGSRVAGTYAHTALRDWIEANARRLIDPESGYRMRPEVRFDQLGDELRPNAPRSQINDHIRPDLILERQVTDPLTGRTRWEVVHTYDLKTGLKGIEPRWADEVMNRLDPVRSPEEIRPAPPSVVDDAIRAGDDVPPGGARLPDGQGVPNPAGATDDLARSTDNIAQNSDTPRPAPAGASPNPSGVTDDVTPRGGTEPGNAGSGSVAGGDPAPGSTPVSLGDSGAGGGGGGGATPAALPDGTPPRWEQPPNINGDWRLGPEAINNSHVDAITKNWESQRYGTLSESEFLSRWTDSGGNWDWSRVPPDGFAQRNAGGTMVPDRYELELTPGTQIDRFGPEGGQYLSPDGTPFEQRALPPGNLVPRPGTPVAMNDAHPFNYYRYEVVRPFTVDAGRIAPAFEQPGNGIQFLLDGRHIPGAPSRVDVEWLVDNGYLRRLPSH